MWDCLNAKTTENGLVYHVYGNEDGTKYIVIDAYIGTETEVVIPDTININDEEIKVTTIGERAFYDNDTITSVTIGNNVTSIGERAFYDCSSLTSITIPNGVITIGGNAFVGCFSLTIYCEATSQPSGWNSNWNSSDRPVVWNCLNAKTTDDGFVYHVYENEDGTKYIVIDAYIGTATEVVIPDTINVDGVDIPVTTIGSYAFSNNDTITSVTIGNNVTTIGERAFSGCSNLNTVTIGENSQLTTIGNSAFYNCYSLISITIPNNVTSIGIATFFGCDSLTSITIPNSVTTIGGNAFVGCSSLTIYCEAASKPSGWSSSWNPSNCPVVWDCLNAKTTEDGLVYYIYENEDGTKYIVIGAYIGTATDVVIPDTISVDGEEISVTAISKNAFYNNDTITSVTIGKNVTTIGERAFYDCDNLTTATFSENSQLTTIGDYAFYNCSNLTTVTFAENSQLTSIADYAFSNCFSLTSIVIPNSVTTIGNYAFSGCSSLTSIVIPNSVTSIGSSVFYGCSNLIIYCEAASQPSGWSPNWNYSDRPVEWGYTGE